MSLFAAIPANACAAYTGLRDGTHARQQAGRVHCDNLWRDFAPLADANFAVEFPIRLHERWFEMYLTVALLRAGLNVTCPKPGPDILLTLAGGTRIWIEATCATLGQPGLPDSVSPPQYAAVGASAVVTSRPTEQMALRIRIHGAAMPRHASAVVLQIERKPRETETRHEARFCCAANSRRSVRFASSAQAEAGETREK
jgi:hypothetical protein